GGHRRRAAGERADRQHGRGHRRRYHRGGRYLPRRDRDLAVHPDRRGGGGPGPPPPPPKRGNPHARGAGPRGESKGGRGGGFPPPPTPSRRPAAGTLPR